MKANWRHVKLLDDIRCGQSLASASRSMILEIEDKLELGGQLFICTLSIQGFFKKGNTLAVLKWCGKHIPRRKTSLPQFLIGHDQSKIGKSLCISSDKIIASGYVLVIVFGLDEHRRTDGK